MLLGVQQNITTVHYTQSLKLKNKEQFNQEFAQSPQKNKISLRADGGHQASSVEVGYALIENILKYSVHNYMILDLKQYIYILTYKLQKLKYSGTCQLSMTTGKRWNKVIICNINQTP